MKCYFCKRDIPKGEGYQWVHVSSTGKEYKRTCCSEEEKYQVERDKELYRLIQYETDTILGRPITNNARNKEIQELHEQYSYEQILRCIRAKADDIKNLIEYNEIKNDYQQDEEKTSWEQYKKEEEEVEIEIEETEVPSNMKVKQRKKLF